MTYVFKRPQMPSKRKWYQFPAPLETCEFRYDGTTGKGTVRRIADGKKFPLYKVHGYLSTTVTDAAGKRRGVKIHRAVGLVFFGLEFGDHSLQVAHENDVKTDNTWLNLSVKPHRGNAADALRNSRTAKGEKFASSKLSDADVAAIRLQAKLYPELNQHQLGALFEISKSQISRVINGLSRAHESPIPAKTELCQLILAFPFEMDADEVAKACDCKSWQVHQLRSRERRRVHGAAPVPTHTPLTAKVVALHTINPALSNEELAKAVGCSLNHAKSALNIDRMIQARAARRKSNS